MFVSMNNKRCSHKRNETENRKEKMRYEMTHTHTSHISKANGFAHAYIDLHAPFDVEIAFSWSVKH